MTVNHCHAITVTLTLKMYSKSNVVLYIYQKITIKKKKVVLTGTITDECVPSEFHIIKNKSHRSHVLCKNTKSVLIPENQ